MKIRLSIVFFLFVCNTYSHQSNEWCSKDTMLTLIKIGCVFSILKAFHTACLRARHYFHKDLSIEENKLYWLNIADPTFNYQNNSQNSLARQWSHRHNANTHNDSLSNHQEICNISRLNQDVEHIVRNVPTSTQSIIHMFFGISIIGVLHCISNSYI